MYLSTSRLTLREYRESDFETLFALDIDPEVLGMRGREAVPLAQAQHHFETLLHMQNEQPRYGFTFIIEHQTMQSPVGRCRLQITNASIREAEIGYHLSPQSWGHGYATETARELLRFGFQDLNLHRIMAKCYVENSRSIHILEKIGMKLEGRMRQNRWVDGVWKDTFIYSILAHEWQ
jgi:RimJ/RimL family protein N-acetyltransferase